MFEFQQSRTCQVDFVEAFRAPLICIRTLVAVVVIHRCACHWQHTELQAHLDKVRTHAKRSCGQNAVNLSIIKSKSQGGIYFQLPCQYTAELLYCPQRVVGLLDWPTIIQLLRALWQFCHAAASSAFLRASSKSHRSGQENEVTLVQQ